MSKAKIKVKNLPSANTPTKPKKVSLKSEDAWWVTHHRRPVIKFNERKSR